MIPRFRIKSLMVNVAPQQSGECGGGNSNILTACGPSPSCRVDPIPTHCEKGVTCDPGPADTMCGGGATCWDPQPPTHCEGQVTCDPTPPATVCGGGGATCDVIPHTKRHRSTCKGGDERAGERSSLALLQEELRQALELGR